MKNIEQTLADTVSQNPFNAKLKRMTWLITNWEMLQSNS